MPAATSNSSEPLGAAAPTRMDTGTVRVDRIDLEEPFYRAIFQTMPRNVELPVVRERWNIRPAAGSDVLLRLQDGSPYLAPQHARQRFSVLPLRCALGRKRQQPHPPFALRHLAAAHGRTEPSHGCPLPHHRRRDQHPAGGRHTATRSSHRT